MRIDTPRPDYPLRVSSFFASVGVHALVFSSLMLVGLPSAPPDKPRKPVYDEFIKPYEHKVLFYSFAQRVPDVTPLYRVGNIPDPRGAELSKQTIIATSRKAKSEQVFISVPAPKIEIHEDVPAPLLVAQLDTSLPPPPPAPKPKQFVPPPPPKQEPKLPIQRPVLDAQAPLLEVPAANPSVTAPALNYSKLAAPPPKAPEASDARSGNATADIAVASLHPVENADTPVPNAERPGRFSKAPTQGDPASGDANATATLKVPDLTIQQPRQDPTRATPAREILYAERMRSVPLSTLSVPLRPASRMIPQAVDARFQGRSVYTIVIPMEHMLAYAGDWIMWFADRESKPGATPVVRAPVPFRKLEAIDEAQPGDRTGERIQFAATLGKNGRLDGITLLSKYVPAIQRAVFQDVTSWEFRPATRDGAPVDVDVVLEIPFSLPTAIAKSTQP